MICNTKIVAGLLLLYGAACYAEPSTGSKTAFLAHSGDEAAWSALKLAGSAEFSNKHPRRLAGDAATAMRRADELRAATRQLLQEEENPTGLAAWNPRVHGYTAAISFGLVMPLAVVISRNFREFRPLWIWLHVPLGLAALIGGIVGVVFGSKLPFDDTSTYSLHKAFGGIVLALAALQVAAGLLRPKPTHPRRFLFNHFHHWTGRLAIAFAIANVYIGLHLSEEEYKFWWGYAIVLGAIVLLWLAKEVVDLFRVLAANRRVGTDGFKGTGLPGGYPMNGSFASVFLQRRPPADAGLPVRGYGVPGDDSKAAEYAGSGHGTDIYANGSGASTNGHTTADANIPLRETAPVANGGSLSTDEHRSTGIQMTNL